MKLRSYFRLVCGGIAILLLISLLSACSAAPTNTPPAANTTAAPASAVTTAATAKWSLAEAAKPYKGKKITMATVAWKDATVDLAKEFTDLTGIEVEVIQLPNAELLQKTLLDARTKTGAYDVFAHSFTTPFAKPGFLQPMDEYLTGALADPEYNLKDAVNVDFYTKYNGKTVSLPFGSSALTLFYRKDLFENAQYQQAFKTKYGYDLKPPTDWKQYLEVAKFFTETEWKSPEGEKGYGVAAYGKREFSMSYLLQLHNGSLASLKNNAKLGLVDEKFQPTFNTPVGEEALAIWKETLNYAPPGSLQNGNTETRDLFAKGLTAMVVTWDSALGTLFTSPVKDKWAIAQVPGRTVLGGWMLSVNASSKNKEAAFLFTQFISNQKSDQYFFDKAGRYPARAKTYTSEAYKAKNPYGDLLAKAKDGAIPQIDVENVQVDTLLSEQISLYLNGAKDAKATLKDSSDGLVKILKDGGWVS